MATQDPNGPSDPFSAFEGERTIIKPGGARAAARGAPAVPPPTQTQVPAEPVPQLPAAAGLSPLMQAAAPLLSAGARLRATAQHANPAALRDALVAGVERFESQARAAGLPQEQVVGGRYIVCSFIDECAASTPWGGSGAWSSRSLLVHFHNESWGGEKVFQLLGRLAENPAQHRALLELLNAVLALGFEGRYRVQTEGREQLRALRERLTGLLRQQAGPLQADLSPAWAGVAPPPKRLADGLPLWVLASIAAALLLLVFVGLRLALHGQTDATFQALQGLQPKAAVAAPPIPAPQPRLATLLAPEIQQGRLAVQDFADRSVVTITGDELFAPGSAELAAPAQLLVQRVAEALAQLPGAVMVNGHSDNQPIRSLRFPSNWHLSQERARSVEVLLAQRVDTRRLRSEGRADSEPLADNVTPAGRAKNRRVEIVLAAGGQP